MPSLMDYYKSLGNPYEEQAKSDAAMLPMSGWAAPLVAARLGQDQGASQALQAQQASDMKSSFEQQQVQDAQKADDEHRLAMSTIDQRKYENAKNVMSTISDLLKSGNTGAAVEIANKSRDILGFDTPITSMNLAQDGLQFKVAGGKWWKVGPSGLQVYTPTTDAQGNLTGQGWQNATPGDLKALQKPAEAPKTRDIQRGNQNVSQEWDATANGGTGGWKDVGNGPKWGPTGGGSGAPSTEKLEGTVLQKFFAKGYQALTPQEQAVVDKKYGNGDMRTAISTIAASLTSAGMSPEQVVGKATDLYQQIQNGKKPAYQQTGAAKTPATPTGFNDLPDPVQLNGKIIRDTVTGKRFQSNGSAWLPVR